MKKLYLVALVVFSTIVDLHAQQDPHYTQYMYNMSVMNPAYSGSKDNLSMGLLYRKQWIEIEDAPTTGTFFGHAPVGKNVGMGLSFISDKIGPVEENNVYGDFSYTLNLGGDHKLAFGLKMGLTFHNVGLYSDINYTLPQPTDPAFSEDISNTYFNLGSGFFYYTNKYYLGLSVPNMLKSKHLDIQRTGEELEFGSETSHYFLTGGYVFDINDTVKFKPFFMMKSAFGAPTSLDLSANFLFYEKLTVGAAYRLNASLSGLVGFQLSDKLFVGYSYDAETTKLANYNSGSHEFFLRYEFNKKSDRVVNPRFF